MPLFLHNPGNQNFRILQKNGNIFVYASGDMSMYPPDSGGGGGPTPPPVSSGSAPGAISSFSTSIASTYPSGGGCVSTNGITLNWGTPADDGGSTITGYVIRRIPVSFIGVNTNASGIPDGYASNYVGDPNGTLPANFNEPCTGSATSNPVSLGVVNTYQQLDYGCSNEPYAYQIAAVNANGTGTWYPSSNWRLSTEGVGWNNVGSSGVGGNALDIEVGGVYGNTVTINYTSTNLPECPNTVNFQNISGKLYSYPSMTLVSTYTGYTQGTLTFTKPGAGWYVVEMTEAWTTYTGTCFKEVNGCFLQRFYAD